MKQKLTTVIVILLIALVSLCACNKVIEDAEESQSSEQEVNYRTVVDSRDVMSNGGYGAVFGSKIDPFDSRYFGALCDMGSVYFSFDKGNSWTRHNIQGTAYCLEYDPSSEGVVWVCGSGVYKSSDHGRTLKMVFPKESELKYAGHNYENANYWLYTDGESAYTPQYQIWSMAIDRKSCGKHVFVGQRVMSQNNPCIRIYQTVDGENFTLFKDLEYCYNYKLGFDEVNNCLVVATSEKIMALNMQGEEAYSVNIPVKVQHSKGNTLCFDSYYDAAKNKNTFAFSTPSSAPHRATTLYKTNNLSDIGSYTDITAQLVERTTDELGVKDIASYNKGRKSYEYCEWINGKTVPQSFAWTIGNVTVLNDDVVYLFHEAETDTFDENGSFYIKRRTHVYLRYDETKSESERFGWIMGFPFKPYNTTIANTSWPDADSGFCFGMSTPSDNENALLYCTNVGVYYTEDGETVTQLNSKVFGKDELTFKDASGNVAKKAMQRVNTSGVDVICTHSLVTDPFDSNHLIMCCTDIGMLQSYDNGKSWYHSLNEWRGGELKSIAYEAYTNTCFEVHFDRERRDVVYGIWSEIKTAPYSPSDKYLTSISRFGISYDGGLSWTMKKITSDGRCLPFKMEVTYRGENRRIYVVTEGCGFFYTDDTGESFVEMNDGLDRAKLGDKSVVWGNDILVCEAGIYAITGGAASDGGDSGNHAFYKWNDDNNRFEKIALPTMASEASGQSYAPAAVRDIEYDPVNKCIYLACIANVVNNGSKLIKTAGGIWKYKDGEFTSMYNPEVSVFSVNLDHHGRLYAAELSGRVLRFDDANSNVELVIDNCFHSLKKVCFSYDDSVLYIPTWGGGTERIILKKVEA